MSTAEAKEKIWDYIVIGAGSSGCALAYQLAKSDSGRSILVLEAGGSDRSPYIKFPAGVIKACANYDWGYRAEPDASRNGAVESWLRGKVVGGCSSINGTIYVRGAAEDFNRWSELCDHAGGWSAEEVMPVFSEMESSDQSGPTRGHSGPLFVRTVRHPHSLTRAFMEAAQANGYRANEDYNGERQEGVAYIQLTQRKGLRWSAADAFLKPLLRGTDVSLLTSAFVEKILVRNGRAEAVQFIHSGIRRTEAARDIILCAGAINSPKLLMLSGIGDSRELEHHKIEVQLDRPNVGLNMREHPLLRMTYRTNIASYSPTEGVLQKLGIAAKYALQREGPIANLFEAMGFVKSDSSRASADLQLFFLAVGYSNKPDGHWRITPYPAVTLYVANSYPAGSGRVRLASGNPIDAPLIDCALLNEQVDLDAMIRGVRTIRSIMSSAPMARYVEEEVLPGPEVTSSEALEKFVRESTYICYHTIGTCRMGADASSVTDPHLRVRGTENLWVADASIMPVPISANTNAACMMIGFKLGKYLAARASRGDS